MALERDEAQEWKHITGKLVDQVRILREVAIAAGFTEETAEIMALELWRVSISHAFTPDLSAIFGKMMRGGEEE